jgi:EAL domain-containing protein (putative c-di-GMP-specific phosphodiesterase class I)
VRNALSVEYQPQFDLLTGSSCGVEALARWVLSTGERIAPSRFIPIAERTGMIQRLGAWVLYAACETAHAWCQGIIYPKTLSVNVSALQINRKLRSAVEECLNQTGFPAGQLELEITESAVIWDTKSAIRHLEQCKALGVHIALDDFGTGYSSLDHLSRLPIDRLKLDQSLIQRMPMDKRSAIIVRSILILAGELGIDVVAEGVETELQLTMLTDLGCPYAQGYLFGRPMSARQIDRTLQIPWGERHAPAFLAPESAIQACHVH